MNFGNFFKNNNQLLSSNIGGNPVFHVFTEELAPERTPTNPYGSQSYLDLDGISDDISPINPAENSAQAWYRTASSANTINEDLDFILTLQNSFTPEVNTFSFFPNSDVKTLTPPPIDTRLRDARQNMERRWMDGSPVGGNFGKWMDGSPVGGNFGKWMNDDREVDLRSSTQRWRDEMEARGVYISGTDYYKITGRIDARTSQERNKYAY